MAITKAYTLGLSGADSDFITNLVDSDYIKTVQYLDDEKLYFGTGQDLKIYSDGSNSLIWGEGTSYLRGTSVNIAPKVGAGYVDAVVAGSTNVSIKHPATNAIKLQTSSTGISVTGTVAATAFTGDGSALTGTGGAFAQDIDIKTADYTVVAGDLGKIIKYVGGNLDRTVTLTAGATLGDGFHVTILNANTGADERVVIDANGTERFGWQNGPQTITLSRGEMVRIIWDNTGGRWIIGEGGFNLAIRADVNPANTAAAGDGANSGVAIGHNAQAVGSLSVALGRSYASGTNSAALAIGDNTSSYGAKHANSIAIGYQAVTTADKQIVLGDSSTSAIIGGDLTLSGDIKTDTNTADLYIKTGGTLYVSDENGHTNASFTDAGASVLYNAHVERLRTNSTGLDVTGIITTDGLTSDGQVIVDGGTGVASAGVLHVRQSGDGLSNGIALTSSHSTSTRIWKDANGKFYMGASSNPSAFVQTLAGDTGIGTASPAKKLHVVGTAQFDSDVTFGGIIAGPSTFYIDPAPVDSDAGLLVIRGDLQVDGTTTTVNSTTVTINDKNIVLADSAANASEADGAGITVEGANATITYDAANDEWDFNKEINIPGGKVTGEIQFQGSSYRTDWLSVGHWNYRDNVQARFGNSDDLKIYHSTDNNSYIQESGSGNLRIMADDLRIQATTGHDMINAIEGGAIELYHNTAKKLETVSSGVTITGDATATKFVQNGTAGSIFYAGEFSRSGSGITTPDVWGTNNTFVIGSSSSTEVIGLSGTTSHFYGDATMSWGNNRKLEMYYDSDYSMALEFDANTRDLILRTKAGDGNGDIRLQTDNGTGTLSSKLTVKADGKVGVGITAPADKMHIKNDSGTTVYKAEVNSNSIVGLGILKTGSTSQEWAIADGVTVNGKLQIYDVTDSRSVMTFDGAGNVGIGTTSPSRLLEVSGSSNPAIRLNNTTDIADIGITSAAGALVTGSTSGALAIVRGGANDINFGTNGQNRVTINSSGNVGIGTTSPAANLEVANGDLAVSAGHIGIGLSTPSQYGSGVPTLHLQGTSPANTRAGAIYFTENTGDQTGAIYSTDGSDGYGGIILHSAQGDMKFSTGALQDYRIVIDTSGNVGIGDSTPTEGKLVVRGDANTNGLFVGGDSTTGQSYGALINAGTNSSDANFRLYDQTGSTPYVIVRGDGISSFRGGHPNISGSSTRVYDVVVNNGISIGDGGYTHGYIGTNGTDGDVYIAANSYPANLGTNRNVIIATGTIGGGGPAEVVRYNNTDGVRRNYSGNTGNNRKWWSTTNTNFGEVYEYDYGNKLYFKKTRSVAGYAQMLLINRYMPNQYDVSFELLSGSDSGNNPYRHFGIALNHVGTENTAQFDYVVLRQRYGNTALNQIRIDQPGGTIGTSEGSSIPSVHDETKRKVMIQKRASTLRIQIHELNSTVYTYGTISGINWTNSSGYFGFSIYESTNSTTWAEISNLTFTDVIA